MGNAEHVDRVRRLALGKREEFDRTLPRFRVDSKNPISSLSSFAIAGATIDHGMSDWRREFPYGQREKLDLSGADLSRAVFLIGTERLLEGADLRKARLDEVVITSAGLEGADLSEASIRSAIVMPDRVGGASFRNADLSGSFVTLTGSKNESPVDFSGANLTDATIQTQLHALDKVPCPRLILRGAKTNGTKIRLNYTAAEAAAAATAIDVIREQLTPGQEGQITWIVEPALWAALPEGHRAMLKRRKAAFGGCFLATAALGTEDDPRIESLRRFRDEVLLQRRSGRVVVAAYETLSPPLARLLERTHAGRWLVRTLVVTPLSRAMIRLLGPGRSC